MQTIADWLKRIGLAEYTHNFTRNNIDVSNLPELSVQDVTELGVRSIGHRRLLMRAIAELNDMWSAQGERHLNQPVVNQYAYAERRQVTIMFADLVGSTPLSARMDPEDLREVIAAYNQCATEAVRSLDGHVAQYLGDGVLACFGYPRAHEDDAERAVRAGLALVDAVAALKTHAALQARVGIATGLVVIGEALNHGFDNSSIVGETPNVAARLQTLAEPNQVVIEENTRRLVGELFELQPLGPQALKGLERPIGVWQAIRRASLENRFEAFHNGSLAELISRKEEIATLLQCWSAAKQGQGQVVLLCGEPGIGKSRLATTFSERLSAERVHRISVFCSQQHVDSPLHPLIRQLERAARFTHDDSAGKKLDKLSALLAQTSTSAEDVGLLSEMLSLRSDGRYPPPLLTPPQRRQRTLEVLTQQIVTLSSRQPLLLLFEDAHWSDPTTLELFDRLIAEITTIPVLLLVTFRTDFAPRWAGHREATTLTLQRMSRREVGEIIDQIAGPRSLASSIREVIIDRTDGIPLFAEEMTKAVLESEGGEATDLTQSTASIIPRTLRASLLARLDRLGTAKRVAQIAAAIGREFSYEVLASVVGEPATKLKSALGVLVQAGLVFHSTLGPQDAYLFKHTLVQDAAYGTLLRDARRELHARIAETLEGDFAEVCENQPELLARHCADAGLFEKAASLWEKAGGRSLARSALVESAEQLKQALNQLDKLPATAALHRDQIRIQVMLINPLMHVKGWAAPETKKAAERANRLIDAAIDVGEPPEDPLLLFSVLYGHWGASWAAFNGNALRGIALQFLELAQKQRSVAPIMIAYRLSGVSLVCTGAIGEGRAHLDRGLELYDPAQHLDLASRFGQDARVAMLSYRAIALWLLGYPDSALLDAGEGLRIAREIGQAATLMAALFAMSHTSLLCGKYEQADRVAIDLADLAQEKGAVIWKTFAQLLKGSAMALRGAGADAVAVLGPAIAEYRLTGATGSVPTWLAYLAGAHARIGDAEEARRCISDAIETVRATNERWAEAYVHQVAGDIELLAVNPNPLKAKECFDHAIGIARAQGAKSLELRASLSVARQYRNGGERKQIANLLGPLYGWFSEGFDTPDLIATRTLLETSTL